MGRKVRAGSSPAPGSLSWFIGSIRFLGRNVYLSGGFVNVAIYLDFKVFFVTSF